jgi:hypothetical protein
LAEDDKKCEEDGQNYIMEAFIIYTLKQILMGCWNQGCDGGMMLAKRETYIDCRLENYKKRKEILAEPSDRCSNNP